MQQINFQGTVDFLADAVSDALFYERHKVAQAVSALSAQSELLRDQDELKNKIQLFVDQRIQIARPKTWHAYEMSIASIEFWHGGKDRFHHRLRYDLLDQLWQHKKLQP